MQGGAVIIGLRSPALRPRIEPPQAGRPQMAAPSAGHSGPAPAALIASSKSLVWSSHPECPCPDISHRANLPRAQPVSGAGADTKHICPNHRVPFVSPPAGDHSSRGQHENWAARICLGSLSLGSAPIFARLQI